MCPSHVPLPQAGGVGEGADVRRSGSADTRAGTTGVSSARFAMDSHAQRRLPARLLGSLTLVSGCAMALAPIAMARAYGLPARPGLIRALGARDVLVGAALLEPSSARSATLLRGLSDALDAVLIASEARKHGAAHKAATGARFAGALGLVGLSARLYVRLSRPLKRQS